MDKGFGGLFLSVAGSIVEDMFEHGWVGDLDGMSACDAVAAAHRDLLEVEARQLLLAAHWIDLHAPSDQPDDAPRAGSSRVLPGTERRVRVGALGTPEVEEFACAEFAALQDMHPLAGANLLAKVANLRERHPLLWRRVLDAEVRGWKALEVARLVGRGEYALSLEAARWVDAQTYEWIDSLPWGQFLKLLEAKIIAQDPEAAEARRKQAEAEQFVATGRSNEYGLKTLIAKATAGDVIFFAAMCDRIAQILLAEGDTSAVGVRRSRAIGILANPARALSILQAAEQRASEHASTPDTNGSDGGEGCTSHCDDGRGAAGEPDLRHRENPDDLLVGDLHPAHDSDDTNHPDDGGPRPGRGPRPCSACGRDGTLTAGLVRPTRVDPKKLLPSATLYLHLTQEAFETGRGVARMEDVGPITVGQARDFLRHCNVKLTPVLDLADRRPVDGYEFPATSREAAHLISPRDVFPYAASTSRRVDLDHPVPYLPPDHGGPPGQTQLGNAAPMVRFHHRIKPHGRWALRQPEPGTYLWRSPHGWHWLIDHTGTHPLSRHLGETLWDALSQRNSASVA